jgi:membrane protease YdiL (CAAX protease family)
LVTEAGPVSVTAHTAVSEELLFRGFIFRWLENGTGTWMAIIISAALFGAAHALNRGSSVSEVTAIGIEAGVLLSAAFVVSRSLWFPIGIHFGWDFAIGAFNGAHRTVESSPVAIVLCLIAGVALLIRARRLGRIMPIRRKS